MLRIKEISSAEHLSSERTEENSKHDYLYILKYNNSFLLVDNGTEYYMNSIIRCTVEEYEALTETDDNLLYMVSTTKDDVVTYSIYYAGVKVSADAHTHSNLDVLNKISESSSGILLFNGQEIIGGSNDNSHVVLTYEEYQALIDSGDVEPNTIYLTTNDPYNLGNDSSLINDTVSSTETTYSSSKIDEIATNIINTIAVGENGSSNMWNKTFLNVGINDILDINVIKENFTLEKLIVQAYKFVEGETDIIQVLKTFDNTDATNFRYDTENVVFDGVMKIKDIFDYDVRINSDGLYESDDIVVGEFVEMSRVEVI